MKSSEVEILIVPGWSSSGPEHWQSRWEKSLKTARRVEQADWFKPSRAAWTNAIAEAVDAASKPVILVAHSLGVISVVHAAGQLTKGKVAGAFLVAPADVENAGDWPVTKGQRFSEHGPDFSPIPVGPLPFASVLIASTSDPYCTLERGAGSGARLGICIGGSRRCGPPQCGVRPRAVAGRPDAVRLVSQTARFGRGSLAQK